MNVDHLRDACFLGGGVDYIFISGIVSRGMMFISVGLVHFRDKMRRTAIAIVVVFVVGVMILFFHHFIRMISVIGMFVIVGILIICVLHHHAVAIHVMPNGFFG